MTLKLDLVSCQNKKSRLFRAGFAAVLLAVFAPCINGVPSVVELENELSSTRTFFPIQVTNTKGDPVVDAKILIEDGIVQDKATIAILICSGGKAILRGGNIVLKFDGSVIGSARLEKLITSNGAVLSNVTIKLPNGIKMNGFEPFQPKIVAVVDFATK